MLNFSNELMVKAKEAKSVEELLNLAKANSIEITEEEAAIYFKQLKQKMGELSDDELDNVAGGGCYVGKFLSVNGDNYKCDLWACYECGGTEILNDSCKNCNPYLAGGQYKIKAKAGCYCCKFYKNGAMGFGSCLNPGNMRD